MPVLPLAAIGSEPVVLHLVRHARAAIRKLLDRVEHVFDRRALPRMSSSVAVDVLPAMRAVVSAHRLVRNIIIVVVRDPIA
jgi:hypothetical protein